MKKRKLFYYLVLSGVLLCSEIFAAVKTHRISLSRTQSCVEIRSTSCRYGIPHSPRGSSEDLLPHTPSAEHERVNIISFSGGGIRGIIPALMAEEFEAYSQAPLYKSFHMMAGTSTGAILAAALSANRNVYRRSVEYTPFENFVNTATLGVYKWWNPYLKAVHTKDYRLRKGQGQHLYSAKDIVDIYRQNANVIFSRTLLNRLSFGTLEAQYCSRGRQNVFNSFFNNLTLKDSLSDLLIPYYNLDVPATNFFKSVHARRGDAYNYYIKDVLMATTAAPTYFDPHFVQSIQQINSGSTEGILCADGGIGGANDPTIFALCEALKRYPEAKIYFILSLGTGEWNRHSIHAHHPLGWGLELSNILVSAPQDVNLYVMERLVGALNKLVIFQHLNVNIDYANSGMDDTSKKNIDALVSSVRNNTQLKADIQQIYNDYIKNHTRNIN